MLATRNAVCRRPPYGRDRISLGYPEHHGIHFVEDSAQVGFQPEEVIGGFLGEEDQCLVGLQEDSRQPVRDTLAAGGAVARHERQQ
jgi:hypothetical protein